VGASVGKKAERMYLFPLRFGGGCVATHLLVAHRHLFLGGGYVFLSHCGLVVTRMLSGIFTEGSDEHGAPPAHEEQERHHGDEKNSFHGKGLS